MTTYLRIKREQLVRLEKPLWAELFADGANVFGNVMDEAGTGGRTTPLAALSQLRKRAAESNRPPLVHDPDGVWQDAWGALEDWTDDSSSS